MYRLIVLLLLVPMMAGAWDKPKNSADQKQFQKQNSFNKNVNRNHNAAIANGGNSHSVSGAKAKAAANSSSDNNLTVNLDAGMDTENYVDVATKLDTSNDINQSYDNRIDFESSPVLTLVPQGHTAGCQRTYGLQFGDSNSGAGIGWPFRDKDCDYDNEAADAFASGQMAIGWYWNCHKKSSYKPFRDRGESVEQARNDCFEKMVSMLVTVPPHQPDPPVDIDINACCKDKRRCGSDHPEIHERIFKACQKK